jgi:cytochrome b subunit of formate dehydrogenase
MPTQKIKRFEISELILHWMQAIPFLLLLLSGALMLAGRTGIISMERGVLERVISFHKVSAVAWLVLTLTSFITNGIRVNLAILKEAHVWHLYDVGWVFTSIAKLLNPGVQVTPAGRFNAGQKLNILGVAFLFIVASASGFVVWTHNTILAAWYVHIACFCMALPQVSVHLYMAMIAPSTRISLGGIFTGWVPKSYVLHHHRLSLPPDERNDDIHPAAPLPRLSVARIIILCLLLLSCVIATGMVYRSHLPRPTVLWRKFNETVVMPGELYRPHRNKIAEGQCIECHSLTADMQNHKCLACHKKIEERMAAGSGHHGTFTGACITCHTEHMGEAGPIKPFDDKLFNHDLAAFTLQGKHRDLACEACHRQTNGVDVVDTFIGHPHDACTDCHKDPHAPTLGDQCAKCHTPRGWKGRNLLFAHHTHSDFKIDALHASVACASCHKESNFKPTTTTCVTCHSDYADAMQGRWHGRRGKPDAHAGLVKCTDCHDVNQQAPQRDKSFSLQCARCHHDGYRRLYSDLQDSVATREAHLLRIMQQRAEKQGSQDTQFAEHAQQLAAAVKVGAHNFSLTHMLLDELEQGLATSPEPMRHPSNP